HVRIPEHCSTRVVFTTGDRATDLSDGIPSSLLGTLGTEGHRTPGRAVFLHEGASHAIQCFS
ncbi:MAG: cell division protein FtsK, partial [Bifidobacterium mongoliense]|nr:cell division protein FtsK [Bifidobacterium mongoliense]